MKLIKLLSSNQKEHFKVNEGLKILNFNEDLEYVTKSFIFEKILEYVFKNTRSSNKEQKIFDLELDYKYYYCDFLKRGIDLNNNDISWWQFDTLLEGIFLQKESTIGQVVTYRCYKKPSKNIKTQAEEEHKFYINKQRQYALPQPKEVLDENINKMWNYLEKQTKQSEVVNNE